MFHGSIVALVTPMQADGRIDETAFLELIEWQIEAKTDGIIVNGTTGEAATTTPEEKVRLLNLAKTQIRGRVPLIAGTGSPCTRIATAMTADAKAQGVDACLILTPYYNKPTQAGLEAHYGQIASAVDIPILLYNAPGRTACDLKPETVRRLCQAYPNIIGIKESSGDLNRIAEIRDGLNREIDLLTGEDGSALAFMQQGGMGVISVTANVAPQKMRKLCEAAKHQDWALAKALDDSLRALHEALFIESNPIPVKWALHQQGRIPKGIRLPLTWLPEDKGRVVLLAMQQANM